MNKQENSQAYFSQMVNAPQLKQLREFSKINRCNAQQEQSIVIDQILYPINKDEVVEQTITLSKTMLVIVSKQWQLTNNQNEIPCRYFTAHEVNLTEHKVVNRNDEFFPNVELAILNGLLRNQGGNDAVMEATVLMLRGMNK